MVLDTHQLEALVIHQQEEQSIHLLDIHLSEMKYNRLRGVTVGVSVVLGDFVYLLGLPSRSGRLSTCDRISPGWGTWVPTTPRWEYWIWRRLPASRSTRRISTTRLAEF